MYKLKEYAWFPPFGSAYHHGRLYLFSCSDVRTEAINGVHACTSRKIDNAREFFVCLDRDTRSGAITLLYINLPANPAASNMKERLQQCTHKKLPILRV